MATEIKKKRKRGRPKKLIHEKRWNVTEEEAARLLLLLRIDVDEDIRERCEKSLYNFVQEAWHLIEPNTKLVLNWHLEKICDHLEAVYYKKITRLIINVPPRTMKSTIVSIMWPVWCWIKDASLRFLTGSHNDKLATRDTLKARRIMEHPWFRNKWPHVEFRKDQAEKKRYENTATGIRIAFGMTSGVTGEGGDIIIIDDPHDAKGAMSEVKRLGVNDSYDQKLSTRLNDSKRGAVVIVMQRLHEDDLTGHLLKKGGWELLRFPMSYEALEPCKTSLGLQDIRTEEGELLWPERFTIKWIKNQTKLLGSLGVAGQLQQRPTAAKGGLVQPDWFKIYDEEPTDFVDILQFWDTAQKANELQNCPWVCLTLKRTYTGLYIIDIFREWMNYPDGKKAAIRLARNYGPNAIVIEDKSSGSSLIQDLQDETMLPVVGFEPESDKITRFATEAPQIEAGIVYLPRKSHWRVDFEIEIKSFPLTKYMDQADVLSMALRWCKDHGFDVDIEELDELQDQVPDFGVMDEDDFNV